MTTLVYNLQKQLVDVDDKLTIAEKYNTENEEIIKHKGDIQRRDKTVSK